MKASFPRQMHPHCLIPRGYSMCIWLKGMEERLTLGFHFSQRQETPSLETKSRVERGSLKRMPPCFRIHSSCAQEQT